MTPSAPAWPSSASTARPISSSSGPATPTTATGRSTASRWPRAPPTPARRWPPALADSLNADPPPHLAKAEAVGGFLNLRLHRHLAPRCAPHRGGGRHRRATPRPTRCRAAASTSSSSRPTPPGRCTPRHGRWAAYGDSLARILSRTGWYGAARVLRERPGRPAAALRRLVAGGQARRSPRPTTATRAPTSRSGRPRCRPTPIPWRGATTEALEDQRETLAGMGVVFDPGPASGPSSTAGAMEATLAELRQLGHVYDADGAVWLRTTELGDDQRPRARAVRRRAHLLPARHRVPPRQVAPGRPSHRRLGLRPPWLHRPDEGRRAGPQPPARATSRSSSGRTWCSLRDGDEVKLSKRMGDIILLREDVIDEVGPDATRFTYLLQSIDTKLVFDLDVVVQRSMDNPVFYVQMAHARLAGIARNAAARGVTRDRSTPSTSACSPTTASRDPHHPERSARTSCCDAADAGPPTRSRRGRGSWPRPCTASTTTAGWWPTTSRPS